jgi:hypothetical protein
MYPLRNTNYMYTKGHHKQGLYSEHHLSHTKNTKITKTYRKQQLVLKFKFTEAHFNKLESIAKFLHLKKR